MSGLADFLARIAARLLPASSRAGDVDVDDTGLASWQDASDAGPAPRGAADEAEPQCLPFD